MTRLPTLDICSSSLLEVTPTPKDGKAGDVSTVTRAQIPEYCWRLKQAAVEANMVRHKVWRPRRGTAHYAAWVMDRIFCSTAR